MANFFNMLYRISVLIFALGMVCPSGPSYADGLRTGFGKVILENIPIGVIYSMRKDSKFPLSIKNESDRKISIKIEVVIPKEGEIQEGYEAIPDTSWIILEQNQFTIEANGAAETDVVINIPDDKKYIGRKFHVFILSYTTGESLGIGLKSKLLFSVGNKTREAA